MYSLSGTSLLRLRGLTSGAQKAHLKLQPEEKTVELQPC